MDLAVSTKAVTAMIEAPMITPARHGNAGSSHVSKLSTGVGLGSGAFEAHTHQRVMPEQ
jgi:cation transporter-like permease